MVKQTAFNDYTREEQLQLKKRIEKFTKNVWSDENPGRGILKRRSALNNKKHLLFHHQPVAAHRLLNRDKDTLWKARKASMLAIHEVGTGKTITAILAVAKALTMEKDKGGNDRPTNKIMIICPKSVLKVWLETLLEWTELTDDNILYADTQGGVSFFDAQDKKKLVTITTPDVLLAAWKTFMYQRKGDAAQGQNKQNRWEPGVDPKNAKRVAEFGGMMPPVHPLFQTLGDDKGDSPYLLTVIDEVHDVGDRTTQKGYVVRKFTSRSIYKLGLTGTPVQAKPDDLAALAYLLDSKPTAEDLRRNPRVKGVDLQQKGTYTIRGNEATSLNKENIKIFHDLLVDRVDVSFLSLPARKVVTLVYDPWVGLTVDANGNNQFDPAPIQRHNELLEEAREASANARVSMQEAQETDIAKMGEGQRKVFAATIALGQMEFSSELGMHGVGGVDGFNVNPSLIAEVAAKPSQAMILIRRVILDRQKACHPRIAVFCEQVTPLKILQAYLEAEGGVGKIFFFDSDLSAAKRKGMIDKFLAAPATNSVFLFSKAGSVGITLCPGCEVLLSVGPLPWNPTTIDQAFGRVYRIGQERPVEIIQFVARRSVTSVKLRLHDDKRNRLGKAAADENYEYFDEDDENRWRYTKKILSGCLPLNPQGNYEMSPERKFELEQLKAEMRRWEAAKEQADANGVAPPPQPRIPPWFEEETSPPLRPNIMPLPEVSFPCGTVA